MSEPYVVMIDQQDPRLGRHIVHDPRSRNFALPVVIEPSDWRDKSVRMYDPIPNPNQTHGNCTGCAKAMEFNVAGNRVRGDVLSMSDADTLYALATHLDPWQGIWPPEDTGSSGLAAAKAAVELGIGAEYRWLFGGANEVVQTLMADRVVNIGTHWYADMFRTDKTGALTTLTPTGGKAGGHQWIARGYDLDRDLVKGRCWWGGFKDFWITRTDLDSMLSDDGDAHVQQRTTSKMVSLG